MQELGAFAHAFDEDPDGKRSLHHRAKPQGSAHPATRRPGLQCADEVPGITMTDNLTGSGREGVAPHFIVIGAQRCGTTWMQRCLIEHPETYVPVWRTGSIYLGSDDMAGYGGEPIIGVFDATILTRMAAPDDIRALATSVKLVAVIRNPMDRAFSWYHLRLRQGDDLYASEPTFAEALQSDPDLISNGIYAPHLRRYTNLVGEDRMWIGLFDDLRTDPLHFMSRVLEFLGASYTSDLPSHWAQAVNYSSLVRSRQLHMLARQAKAGTKRLLGTRNQWIVDRVEQSRWIKAFKRANENQAPTLDEATRAELFESFAQDIGELEELLGRDLSQWRPKGGFETPPEFVPQS
jgi:hypothetical protein